jgi:hypothetical protein
MSGSILQNLLADARKAPGADTSFSPVARYYPGMDFLLYLNEDCSYRADRIDPFLTVLWHPYEDRLVGVKLKGFRFLFERIKSVLDLKEDHFVLVVKAIEIALVGGVAEAMMQKQETKRIMQMYEEARKITAGARFDAREVERLAA